MRWTWSTRGTGCWRWGIWPYSPRLAGGRRAVFRIRGVTPGKPGAILGVMNIDREAFERTRRNAIERLLSERDERGVWVGELSSSALSTATAITTFFLHDRDEYADRIAAGVEWLLLNQNADGGWGDTDKSFSNISTTTLCWAALGMITTEGHGEPRSENQEESDGGPPWSPVVNSIERAEAWLTEAAGSMEPAVLVESIMARYGKDRTFSVPILTMATLCGRFGPPEDSSSWKWVKQLPFELAALPQSWYRRVNLQVVSYALPALIAIGQVRHHHRPTWNPITRALRWMTRRTTFAALRRIQPSSGGYLEATPLTSFVCMSLAGMREALTPDARDVLAEGLAFLEASQRGDGSWAIDTNLATWVTTLSVNALASGSRLNEYLDESERGRIRDWLLDQQYTEVHPFTGAAPGGWAWTDLPGGVPDADDTSGALIALHQLDATGDATIDACVDGLWWLQGVRNRDGGTPTFCRGWGRLPFDRSSNDISAHALIAEQRWWATMTEKDDVLTYIQDSDQSADRFLRHGRNRDGSWEPLWFGNQHADDEANRVYGTSRVSLAFCDERAEQWLRKAQNTDGGWGGDAGAPSSVEETALALEAVAAGLGGRGIATPQAVEAVERGVAWLIEHTDEGTSFEPAPIGFYFAKLWYYEKLYPIVWTVGALERVAGLLEAGDADGLGAGR